MKIANLLNIDNAMTTRDGQVVQPSIASAIFGWKPTGGGRQAAIIVSKLATNRARMIRLIGPESEYGQARQSIIQEHTKKDESGKPMLAPDNKPVFLGETPEDQQKTEALVMAAIGELVRKEVEDKFEQIDLGALFDLGCSLTPEQVDALSFMLDTSSLAEPEANV
jgi:hypothetical protein